MVYAGGAAASQGGRRGGGHRRSTCTRRTCSTWRRPTTGSGSRAASSCSRRDAAAEIGAKGVIVHGGHVLQGRRPGDRLRQLAQVHRRAGDAGAAADREHRRRRQRDGPAAGADRPAVGRRSARPRAATPSGSASTPATPTPAGRSWRRSVERVLAITGRIDLVHANDSRDAFDSGADRHANFGDGPDRARRRSPGGPRSRGSGRVRDARRARGPGGRHRLAEGEHLTKGGKARSGPPPGPGLPGLPCQFSSWRPRR